MALAPSGSVLLIVCIPCLGGELVAERGEMPGLVWIRGVPVGGAAVGIEVVRLVQFPDLVTEGVLDGVTALFAQAVGPYVAVFD
jgi:hypothetical protein